ncbi:ATPase [methanogenic archaeon mixed culture ISO4-G1]|nr:ATPase [methanogenic archaeon mixed culture ISO4-G1]
MVATGRASDRFRGVMAENYVAQSLTANDINVYYWNPDQYTEVDFIIQDSDGEVVPIEVKSGDRTNSKSLAKLRDKYSPRSSIRLSSKNFGSEDGLYSIPLYAAFCIDGNWAKKVADSK